MCHGPRVDRHDMMIGRSGFPRSHRMDDALRLRRRVTFDAHPESYVRARPAYPPELIADLRALAHLAPDSRILEIGCGPGTLTQSLAQLPCEVTALELGEHLAEFARRAVARYPRVHVLHASFDEWPLPSAPFDVVVLGAAYHWLDPTTRVAKILTALKPGGCLAIANKHRISSGDAELERDIQECYLRWDPEAKPGFKHPEAAEVTGEIEEIEAEPQFVARSTRRYREDVFYSAERYRHLLRTYSDFLLLEPSAQEGLANCLTSLIETRCGGVYRLPILCTLYVAQKGAEGPVPGPARTGN